MSKKRTQSSLLGFFVRPRAKKCKTRVPVKLVDTESSVSQLHANWLSRENSEKIFQDLLKAIDHMTHDKVCCYDGSVRQSKRILLMAGEKVGTVHKYGKTTRRTVFDFNQWPWLQDIRARLSKLCQCNFNVVFIHFYRPYSEQTPDDAISFHSDSGPELIDKSPVASLSIGDTRTFSFRDKQTHKICSVDALHSGDLVTMHGDIQHTHEHAVTLKGIKNSLRGRFNLSFRCFKK